MKKLLFIALSFSGVQAMTPEQCRDVLDEIKKGRPYTTYETGRGAVIKVLLDAKKLVNDPFASPEEKKNAQRRCKCAEAFPLAGNYYTGLMELENLHQGFTAQQKTNPKLTTKEFLSGYAKDSIVDPIERLSLFTQVDVLRGQIATKEEEAMGQQWNKAFHEHLQAAGTLPSGSQKADSIIDKYING